MVTKGDFITLAVPCAPMRSDASDAAEMVSEALAGEAAIVKEVGEKDWIRIELAGDGYQGWSDRKQWKLDDVRASNDSALKPFLLQAPTSPWLCPNGAVIQLPAGSIVHLNASSKWSCAGVEMEPLFSMDEMFQVHSDPLDAANSFLGAPYRWGGRCVWGMDCSGLMQLAYLLCGQRLPRDASQQAKEGEQIDWNERSPGDLAFFQNDAGRIVHVGILISREAILHAAGEVRLDQLKETGIWSGNQETHAMAFIRRV